MESIYDFKALTSKRKKLDFALKAKAAKPLFKTISTSVEKDSDIKWNFTKFLVDRNGQVVKRFEPTDKMEVVEKAISEILNKK